MLFNELGLSADLLRAVDEQGYEKPTPIQREAIPHILDGHDILAGAQKIAHACTAATCEQAQECQQWQAEKHRLVEERLALHIIFHG